MSPRLTPEPKVMRTPNLTYWLVFTNIFQKNWFLVVDVIIVTSQPYFEKLHHFCKNVADGLNFAYQFVFEGKL